MWLVIVTPPNPKKGEGNAWQDGFRRPNRYYTDSSQRPNLLHKFLMRGKSSLIICFIKLPQECPPRDDSRISNYLEIKFKPINLQVRHKVIKLVMIGGAPLATPSFNYIQTHSVNKNRSFHFSNCQNTTSINQGLKSQFQNIFRWMLLCDIFLLASIPFVRHPLKQYPLHWKDAM